MARESADREDLLREATALVERVELSGDALPAGLVAGFRRDGCLSLFFGPDPVYQFNSRQQLRRAFIDANLYKAERGRLVRLTRESTPDETRLVRHELTGPEQTPLVAGIRDDLRQLAQTLDEGAFQLVGQVPPDGEVLVRLRTAIERHRPVEIAETPHAR